ncbi:MAG TPA: NAD(P)/FAD-dependent oxidoreductase [Candidatus Dependentiae bacterium]|nr:NAD(P)/FAD-dependent oxidoreductase [Candidatus Dependentiae bacterium]
MKFDYDVAVIGGGAGGLTAAKMARGFGKRVVLIEKTGRLGGECTWTGCVPSKTLIKAAQIAFQTQQMKKFGLKTTNEVLIDTTMVMDHVRAVVEQVYRTHTPERIEQEGITVLFGIPSFLDAYRIQLDDNVITAKKIIIATGSSPLIPPIDGIDQVNYLTNETLFDLKTLPKSMVILGAGPIGVEMASALNRLGVEITLIEMQDRILPREDAELVALLTEIMKQEGVNILTGTRATKVTKKNSNIILTSTRDSKIENIGAETLLVATGRKSNIADLALHNAQVNTDKNGIVVDKNLRTTAPTIYACGDVVGPYLFSHMAWYQAVIATRNALIPFFKKSVDYTNVIWVTFSAPELATAGLTEQAAREKYGNAIHVYRRSYDSIDRAHTDGTTTGLIKVITDKKDNILGLHIIGERAGDIVHEIQLAKTKGMRLADLHTVIHAYPTYAELNWLVGKSAYLDKLERNIVIRWLKWLFLKTK